jgi:dienelactone hydrolase
MLSKWLFRCTLLILVLSTTSFAQTPNRGANTVTVRGKEVDVYYYPAVGDRLNRKVLFAPGDGGWRGFAVEVAERMASWGYDVYGLDTKTYLEGFTEKGSRLKETDVMTDFRSLAQWITADSNESIILVGWSEGAGLTLLASAAPDNRETFEGLVTFGLGRVGILGWRWVDDLTYITKADPHEPKFVATSYMPQIAPKPLLMIQSTHDDYVSADEARALFSAAQEPKRFALLQGRDHKFSGNQDEFFRTLQEGLEWMTKKAGGKERRASNPGRD